MDENNSLRQALEVKKNEYQAMKQRQEEERKRRHEEELRLKREAEQKRKREEEQRKQKEREMEGAYLSSLYFYIFCWDRLFERWIALSVR